MGAAFKGPLNTSPPKPTRLSPPNSDKEPCLPPPGIPEPPITAGATATGAAITVPPMDEAISERAGDLPNAPVAGDPGEGPMGREPFGFRVTPPRRDVSFVDSLLEEPRFSGVRGVSVVCGAGGSAFPDTLWTPATTDAAETPDGFGVPMPIEPLGAGPPKDPLEDEGALPADEALTTGLGAGVPACGPPFAADMLGNPEPTLTALVDAAGAGTRFEVEGFDGSSYVGSGKTGFEQALPVPDGPPPPTLRRGADPAAPLAALSACCTICC